MSAALFVDAASLEIGLKPARVNPGALVAWAEEHVGQLSARYWFDGSQNATLQANHSIVVKAGFRVEICPTAPRGTLNGKAQFKQVGVDVCLAINAIESRLRDGWTTLVLATGDGDFFPLAKNLAERHNVRVMILSVPENTNPYLSAYASTLYDLRSVAQRITFEPHSRLAPAFRESQHELVS